MKKVIILAVWILAGGVVALLGKGAWDYFSNRNPDEAREVAEQVRETVATGKDAVNQVADKVKKATADEADAGSSATPNEPAPARSAEARENEINHRLDRLAQPDEVVATATPAPSTSAAASMPEEVRRQREQDALIRRQMAIVDELYGE